MAQIRADEISRVLQAEIENFDAVANVSETGSVISVGDGIAGPDYGDPGGRSRGGPGGERAWFAD
jgi:F0F1-type ATP synthase alpha subunit